MFLPILLNLTLTNYKTEVTKPIATIAEEIIQFAGKFISLLMCVTVTTCTKFQEEIIMDVKNVQVDSIVTELIITLANLTVINAPPVKKEIVQSVLSPTTLKKEIVWPVVVMDSIQKKLMEQETNAKNAMKLVPNVLVHPETNVLTAKENLVSGSKKKTLNNVLDKKPSLMDIG